MDSCREIKTYKTNGRTEKRASETLSDVLASAAMLFGFLFYFIGSVADKAARAVRTGSFAYFMGLHRRAVCGIGAGIAIFTLIGIVGGIEAGLISLAIGTPLCLGLALAVKIFAED